MKSLLPIVLAVTVLCAPGCRDRRTPEQLTDALFQAAADGNAAEIVKLLEKGADVNGEGHPSKDLPLRIAAVNGHVDCVKALLNAGADPSRTVESGGNGGTTLVFRSIVSVQSALYLLKQAKETPPALLPMMNPALKETLDKGVTVEAYEEIIRLLEEAESRKAGTI